jgi:NAD(P)-dependent dehydrogenase (short-subunit alcohol dehydrogenase family)
MTIKDKTVLVTGANRGIGKALAAEALARGARRVYAGTRQSLAHPDDRVTPLSLDITSTAQIQAAAGQVETLDMLINNAGIALPDDLTDLAALERHLEEIFPDPASAPIAALWRDSTAKLLERQLTQVAHVSS